MNSVQQTDYHFASVERLCPILDSDMAYPSSSTQTNAPCESVKETALSYNPAKKCLTSTMSYCHWQMHTDYYR
jgi:hypothetical protein